MATKAIVKRCLVELPLRQAIGTPLRLKGESPAGLSFAGQGGELGRNEETHISVGRLSKRDKRFLSCHWTVTYKNAHIVFLAQPAESNAPVPIGSGSNVTTRSLPSFPNRWPCNRGHSRLPPGRQTAMMQHPPLQADRNRLPQKSTSRKPTARAGQHHAGSSVSAKLAKDMLRHTQNATRLSPLPLRSSSTPWLFAVPSPPCLFRIDPCAETMPDTRRLERPTRALGSCPALSGRDTGLFGLIGCLGSFPVVWILSLPWRSCIMAIRPRISLSRYRGFWSSPNHRPLIVRSKSCRMNCARGTNLLVVRTHVSSLSGE